MRERIVGLIEPEPSSIRWFEAGHFTPKQPSTFEPSFPQRITMRTLLPFCLLALAIGYSEQSLAQTPGSTDLTFATGDLGGGIGDGADDQVIDILIQPDGKILIAGGFAMYNATNRLRLARLNADGTLDATFVNTSVMDWGVDCIALQADGKVLAGGPFTTYGGEAHSRIVRTLTNGSPDATFVAGTGFNDEVDRILLQPDGKILVIGGFSSYNGTPCMGMCRLLTNGTIDASFNAGTGPAGGSNGAVFSMVRFPNGQILLGGDFSSFNGAARNNLVLLNTDGSVSNAFIAPGTGPNAWVSTLEMAGTNRVLLGGWFTDYNGTSAQGLLKVDLTGAVDATFNTTSGFAGHIEDIVVQTDGKVIAVGDFTSYAGTTRSDIARLNTNGTLDATFNTTTAPSPYAWCVALRADGKVLLGESVPAPGRQNLMLLNTNGTPDMAFATGTGITASSFAITSRMLFQSDGKIMVLGVFDQVWNTARPGLARLNGNGTLDATFDPGTGPSAGDPWNIALQTDNKLLVAGSFTGFNGTPVGRIVRLLTTGAIDASFATGTGFSGAVFDIAVQPDGRIVVAGNFNLYNGTICQNLVRLMPTGALDASFVPGTAPNTIQRLAVQPDGRILVSGSFTTFNGTPRARIARLLANGTLDTTFDPGTGPSSYVDRMTPQPDGRILIKGGFTNVGGVSRLGFARLLADGMLDPSFVPWTSNGPQDLALQPNGKVLVIATGGTMVRRLHPNGDLDPTFSTTASRGFCLLLQADGKVLVGGDFTAINGVGRNRIARVNGGDPVVSVAVKTFLEGPYSSVTQTMNDGLRAAGVVPLTEPYTALGYPHEGGGGGESVAPALLAITGINAIVDWVVVELRSDASTEVATRSALLQRDGDVVALDGLSPVSFSLPVGNYFVAVRHRNHLGVLTSAALALTSTTTVVDFTQSATATYGTEGRKTIGTRMALWAGNVVRDQSLKSTGANNDRDPILTRVGSTTPNSTVSGYYMEDVTMDGVVKYTGANNDRDPILLNVGSTTPNSTRTEQVP